MTDKTQANSKTHSVRRQDAPRSEATKGTDLPAIRRPIDNMVVAPTST